MRKMVLVLFLAGVPTALLSQAPPGRPLSDYVGAYDFMPGRSLEIIAGAGLFAVIDSAKYKLQPAGVDQFTNVAGVKIPFLRDANGKVIGYKEDGKFHWRISANVTPESAALAWPRPKGQDSPYHYRIPADLDDGISVGNIAKSDFGLATASSTARIRTSTACFFSSTASW